MSALLAEAFAYCEAQLREADKDLYLSSLFAPAQWRQGLFALYAFDREIARARDVVREPLAGEVRLQWWRDVLAGSARGEVSANPIAAALIATMRRHRLDADKLMGLIDARSAELFEPVLPTLAELERRAQNTGAVRIRTAAHILGVSDEPRIAGAAGHAGVALTVCNVLRRFAQRASSGLTSIPEDLLRRHGANRADIFAGRTTPALRAAFADLRAHAEGHLDRLGLVLAEVPARAFPAFLPAALVRSYLAVVGRADYDPFRTPVELPQWRKQWILWRAARRPARIAG